MPFANNKSLLINNHTLYNLIQIGIIVFKPVLGAGAPKNPVVRELFVDAVSGRPIGE